MNKTVLAAAAITFGIAPPAFADSAVRIYGVLDTALQHLESTDGSRNTSLLKTGHAPSRLGFEGNEDLGGGLRAGFVLETGVAVPTGEPQPAGTLFGRMAYISLDSDRAGTLKIGRQFSLLQHQLVAYDPDHFSEYSPVLAMQLADLDQTSLSNMISYQSPEYAGLSFTVAEALGEKAAVVPAPVLPQIVGAGTAKNIPAAAINFRNGKFAVGAGFQGGGQNLAAGGSTSKKLYTVGASYELGPVAVGGVWWRQSDELPNGSVPKVSTWALGASWALIKPLRLVAEVGRATDNGLGYSTGKAKADGKDTYLNFGATYFFSKLTQVEIRFGRVSDQNGGYNGRPIAVSPNGRAGVAVLAGQAVKGAALGLRKWF